MFSSDISARDTRQPFTVLLPDTAHTPIVIHDNETSLAMAVVDKSCVHLLDNTWNTAGVYILLSSVDDNGCYTAYVGKAPAGLRSRLLSHEKAKVWARALLITRVSFNGFSSAHAGWLEGDLYDLLTESGRTHVENVQVPGDKTVSRYDLRMLTSLRDPIVRVLRLLGYETALPPLAPAAPVLSVVEPVAAQTESAPSTDPASTSAAAPKPRRRRQDFVGVKVADLIAAGLIRPGEKLVAVRRGWSAAAEVGVDGAVIHGGVRHRSPSGAAVAVRGDATDGWSFWAVERHGRAVPLRDLRQQLLDERDNAAEPSPDSAPSAPKRATAKVSVADLIAAGLVERGEVITSVDFRSAAAKVTADGRIEYQGQLCGSLSAAGRAVTGGVACPGWDFWGVARGGRTVPLSALREQYLEESSGASRASAQPGGVNASQHLTRVEPVLCVTDGGAPVRAKRKPRTGYGVKTSDLVEAGLLRAGEVLSSTSPSRPATTTLNPDGTLTFNDRVFKSVSGAGKAVTGRETDGWMFWGAWRDGSLVSLERVRDEFVATRS